MSKTISVQKGTDQPTTTTSRTGETAVSRETDALRVTPRADILENKHGFVVHLDLPGVPQENVNVHLEEGVLSVSGRTSPVDHGNRRPQYGTPGVTEYYRSFQIPDNVDSQKIGAKVRHGVLTLELPKMEEARPREIPVKGS